MLQLFARTVYFCKDGYTTPNDMRCAHCTHICAFQPLMRKEAWGYNAGWHLFQTSDLSTAAKHKHYVVGQCPGQELIASVHAVNLE